MAPTSGAAASAKAAASRHKYKTNAVHKKRRAERDMPKTNKRTTKNRIRDLGRLLRKKEAKGADAAEIVALKAEIASLDGSEAAALLDRKRVDREKRYAERYRKIKFFEKQKVRRKLKKLRKAPAPDAAAEKALEDDLLYIEHYPKDRKYVSLFDDLRKTGEKAGAKANAKRAAVRKIALANAAAAAAKGGDSDSDSSDSDSDSSDSDSDSPDSDAGAGPGAAAAGGPGDSDSDSDSDEEDEDGGFFLDA